MNRFLLLFVTFICLSATVFSQQPKPFRVGVVLSGGGAKGYAHVGVLKVLEEAGIRIDYIGGASMGAIVGGLYASGLTSRQLDSILRVTDMVEVLQDQTRREYQPFFEKEYGERYALRLSFDDYKISLPQAFSSGQSVFDFLSALTDPVSAVQDFSQLPIPFLCIGTDVTTGEEVIMEKGCLARSIRASGSLPGLLAPVEIDNRLISDGGIVNNFPAKEVRDKGMDIIIGVTVESGLYKKKELQSIQNIITQIGSFQMEARSREQMKFCDIIIRPDVEGYSVTSFDATDTLLLRGERAARRFWNQLTDIAKRQKAAPAPPRNPPPDHSTCPMYINDVHISKNSVYTNETLLGKFPVQLPGEISSEKFREGINALFGTDNFQSIDYQFKTVAGSNTRELFIKPTLKPGYERSLRLGLHFDNVYKSSLLLNGTFRNVLLKNSITSLDCIIGDKFRYNFHYFVDLGRFPDIGFNSRLNFTDMNIDLPVKLDVGNTLQIQSLLFNVSDFTQEIYFNLASGTQFATGLATELKFFKTATSQAISFQSDDQYVNERGWYSTQKAFLHYDTRNQLFFPHTGTRASVEVRITTPLSSRKYQDVSNKTSWNLDAQYRTFLPITSRLTGLVSADAGITLGTPAPPNRYFIGSNNENLINNFRQFTGLPFAKAGGWNLLKCDLGVRYFIPKRHYITAGLHLAWLDDVLKPFSSGTHLYRSIGVGYGIDTPLGPVELTYGIAEHRGSVLYFNLGYWF
jgi:NTE family protein